MILPPPLALSPSPAPSASNTEVSHYHTGTDAGSVQITQPAIRLDIEKEADIMTIRTFAAAKTYSAIYPVGTQPLQN